MKLPYEVRFETAKPAMNSTCELGELLGPVKYVMQTTYRAHVRSEMLVQGKVDGDSSITEKNFILTYDEAGTKIHQLNIGESDKEEKTFDQAGRVVTTSHQHLDGKFMNSHVHKYDAKGNLVETRAFLNGGIPFYRTTHIFNDNNQLIEDCQYKGPEESLFNRTVYTYTEQNHLLSKIDYNSKGEVDHSYINIFNEKGLHIENRNEHTDPKKRKYDSRHTMEYNEQGDCIAQIFYDSQGHVKSSHAYTYKYDSEGKKIIPPNLTNERDEELAKLKYETENDARGNWIKKTVYYDKLPVNIICREFIYFDQNDDRTFTHQLIQAVKDETKVEKAPRATAEMKPEIANWLVEEHNRTADNFSHLRYYAYRFHEFPSMLTYTGPYIEAMALLNELKADLGAEVIHTYYTAWHGYKRLQKYTLQFPAYWGYLLHATGLTSANADDFMPTSTAKTTDGEHYYISQFQLLAPAENSENYDSYFNEVLNELVDKCSLEKKPNKPRINIAEVSGSSYVMKEHAVDNAFIIRDLDVNYGHGFAKFHTDLMHRFNTSTKGLVLFHGEPGTGKTYYVRHLLRSMVANRKVVIYMPPNMVDHLVEPTFMSFLIKQVHHFSDDGNFCVLLIEDAEPLLAKRQEGVRIQGITNLLNMTDGLLNDMLNLQIICTFNVDLKKLDSALLRPGRLIARKEFKPLSELDANLLAQRLGIKHHFTQPASLGEIYAMMQNSNTLIHDVEPGRDASKPIDDLV